jgi:hypothetical protein
MCTCMSMSWLEVAGIQRRTMTSTDPTLCFPGSFFISIEEAAMDLRKCRNFMECRNCIFVSYLDVVFITVNSLFSSLHLGFYGIMPKPIASAESTYGTSITRTSLNKNINRLSVFSLYLVVVCTTVELVEYHFPEGSRPIAWGCSSAYDLGLPDNPNTAHLVSFDWMNPLRRQMQMLHCSIWKVKLSMSMMRAFGQATEISSAISFLLYNRCCCWLWCVSFICWHC